VRRMSPMMTIGRPGHSASSHEVFPSLKRRSHLCTVERDRAMSASVLENWVRIVFRPSRWNQGNLMKNLCSRSSINVLIYTTTVVIDCSAEACD
jgi:hypothetical protein